jgi:aspartyl-tRNA(Asn)/glutamyl-tRNA(Gln) amidotransferase subunit C
MSLSDEQVRQIAHLARLGVGDEELSGYADSLNAILGFVDALTAADTAGIEPLAHPVDMVQRLRPDEVTEVDQRDRFQAIAPAVEAGLYLVPRVIE